MGDRAPIGVGARVAVGAQIRTSNIDSGVGLEGDVWMTRALLSVRADVPLGKSDRDFTRSRFPAFNVFSLSSFSPALNSCF